MAIRRSTTRRSSSRSPQRKLVWARQAQSPSASIPANTNVIIPLLQGFQLQYGADLIGATIRRIRGWHGFRGAVAGNSIRASIGIGVFPENSSAANIAPAANRHLDWMYFADVFAEPVVATEFATINMWERDVRSQRRMEELGDALLMVIVNTHPTDNLAYTYSSSVLLALP